MTILDFCLFFLLFLSVRSTAWRELEHQRGVPRRVLQETRLPQVVHICNLCCLPFFSSLFILSVKVRNECEERYRHRGGGEFPRRRGDGKNAANGNNNASINYLSFLISAVLYRRREMTPSWSHRSLPRLRRDVESAAEERFFLLKRMAHFMPHKSYVFGRVHH